MSTQNIVIFARSNYGPDSIHQQVHCLREFALQRGLRVVSETGMPHTSANDGTVEQTLTGLVAKPFGEGKNPAVLVTDYSRLSRDSIRRCHLLDRLRKAGWDVIRADGSQDLHGAVAEALNLVPENQKKVAQRGNKKNRKAGGSADAEADDRGRDPRVP